MFQMIINVIFMNDNDHRSHNEYEGNHLKQSEYANIVMNIVMNGSLLC